MCRWVKVATLVTTTAALQTHGTLFTQQKTTVYIHWTMIQDGPKSKSQSSQLLRPIPSQLTWFEDWQPTGTVLLSVFAAFANLGYISVIIITAIIIIIITFIRWTRWYWYFTARENSTEYKCTMHVHIARHFQCSNTAILHKNCQNIKQSPVQ